MKPGHGLARRVRGAAAVTGIAAAAVAAAAMAGIVAAAVVVAAAVGAGKYYYQPWQRASGHCTKFSRSALAVPFVLSRSPSKVLSLGRHSEQ
jgi:hypothetical protein